MICTRYQNRWYMQLPACRFVESNSYACVTSLQETECDHPCFMNLIRANEQALERVTYLSGFTFITKPFIMKIKGFQDRPHQQTRAHELFRDAPKMAPSLCILKCQNSRINPCHQNDSADVKFDG